MAANDFTTLYFRYVVEPYKKYPSLLEVLLNFLKNEQSPGIRKEVHIYHIYSRLEFLFSFNNCSGSSNFQLVNSLLPRLMIGRFLFVDIIAQACK